MRKQKNKIIAAVSLTVGATASIAIANKIIKTIATVKNSLAKSEGNYFDWRFGKIYYKKAGNEGNYSAGKVFCNTKRYFSFVLGSCSHTGT